MCELSGELNANRPVPFRLTPNIAEFLTIIGVTGPLTAAMLVTARCFVYPPYKISSYLSAILRDEYITWHKKVFFNVVLYYVEFIESTLLTFSSCLTGILFWSSPARPYPLKENLYV